MLLKLNSVHVHPHSRSRILPPQLGCPTATPESKSSTSRFLFSGAAISMLPRKTQPD